MFLILCILYFVLASPSFFAVNSERIQQDILGKQMFFFFVSFPWQKKIKDKLQNEATMNIICLFFY